MGNSDNKDNEYEIRDEELNMRDTEINEDDYEEEEESSKGSKAEVAARDEKKEEKKDVNAKQCVNRFPVPLHHKHHIGKPTLGVPHRLPVRCNTAGISRRFPDQNIPDSVWRYSDDKSNHNQYDPLCPITLPSQTRTGIQYHSFLWNSVIIPLENAHGCVDDPC